MDDNDVINFGTGEFSSLNENFENILVELFSSAELEDVKYDGVLTIEGEENDDIWRIIFEDSVGYRLDPVIVWDDNKKTLILN